VLKQQVQQTSVARETDPASDLIDALYALAEHPENWLKAIEAVERLPPLDQSDQSTAERLAAHAARAAALAERLNEARRTTVNARERWDAVLLSADGHVRTIVGNIEQRLRPYLSAPLAPLQRPEFHQALRDAFKTALDTASGGRHAGFAHWTIQNTDEDERRLAIVMSRAAFPSDLSRAFGLIEVGPEPLYALVLLRTDDGANGNRVRESLGLTRAEWRLAQALKTGVAMAEAADRLNISVNTARTQAKSIFAKLGVARQSELVSRLTIAEQLDLAPTPTMDVRPDIPPRRIVTLDDGRRLAYREYGNPRGKPVIAFHQWFAASMLSVGGAEAAKDSGLRLIVFDRPGFGQSTPVAPYAFEGVARDAFALADRLQIMRLRLFGMAPGVSFAMAAAALSPARVEKVALAAPRFPTAPGAQKRRAIQRYYLALLRHPWIMRSLFSTLRSGTGERIAAAILRHGTSESAADRAQVAKPAIARAILAQAFDAHEMSTDGLAAELELFSRQQLPDARDVKCPIAVWHGEEDPVTPLAQCRQAFAQVPDEDFHVVKNAGVIADANAFREMFAWLAA
jgi:pimeloyl-ACP methyl ester carboxylesterase/DNA-binding CsgD family transcriptional regulator